MGGRGSSSGASKSGGAGASRNIESSVMEFKAANLNVPLSGDQQTINEAAKIRNSIAREMVQYSLTRTSDGKQINPEYIAKYTTGTKSEIANFMQERASSLSFGNESLYNEKIQQQITTQNDLVKRATRMAKVFSENTEAKFWLGKNTDYSKARIKDYIDGKTDKVKWII